MVTMLQTGYSAGVADGRPASHDELLSGWVSALSSLKHTRTQQPRTPNTPLVNGKMSSHPLV